MVLRTKQMIAADGMLLQLTLLTTIFIMFLAPILFCKACESKHFDLVPTIAVRVKKKTDKYSVFSSFYCRDNGASVHRG